MAATERNVLHPSHYHIVKGPDGTRKPLTHEQYFKKEQSGENPLTTVFDRLRHHALEYSGRLI